MYIAALFGHVFMHSSNSDVPYVAWHMIIMGGQRLVVTSPRMQDKVSTFKTRLFPTVTDN